MLDIWFDHLSAWLAAMLCFTVEEAWLSRNGDDGDGSVHLRTFPQVAMVTLRLGAYVKRKVPAEGD